MKNISKEDYLSVIFKHNDSNLEIKPNVIAIQLNISKSAVTDMLKKLAREKLVNYTPYKSITLTAKGEVYARNLVRRHRLWELFLYKIIGMSWEKVHQEAELLEHSGSDELIDKMEKILNYPKYDPHGAPIPGKDGSFPKGKKIIQLSSAVKGQAGIVKQVNDYDFELLKYVSNIGISLNKEIFIVETISFDKSILIEYDKKKINISSTIAENIFIELIKQKNK